MANLKFHVKRYLVHFQDLYVVQKYEQEIGGIHLDPSYGKDNAMYFSVKNPHTLSSRYADVYEKKAHLVIRMLELHIGQELLIQVCVNHILLHY